jgi:hypothetical protein
VGAEVRSPAPLEHDERDAVPLEQLAEDEPGRAGSHGGDGRAVERLTAARA